MKHRKFIVIAIVLTTLALFFSFQFVLAESIRLQSDLDTTNPNSPVTNQPLLDLSGPNIPGNGFEAIFTEDQGAVLIVGPELSLTDSDSANMQSATLTLQARPNGDAEILAANPPPGTNINVSYNNGKLRLTGIDTITNYQSVLRTITYNNLSNAPDINDRRVVFVVNDGANNSDPVESNIAINAVNDAPVLDPSGNMILPDILEDTIDQLGRSVATIIASAETGGEDRITDLDYPNGDAPEGIAVIEAGSGNGKWQYSTDSGSSWLDFGAVSNNSAVLLNTNARIRFVPVPHFHGQAIFSFRAWDQAIGSNGSTNIDVTINGGTTAFSSATETVALNILPVNDLPQLDLNGVSMGYDFVTSFVGNSDSASIVANDATITDIDNSELVSATITLTNQPDGTAEFLENMPVSTTVTINPYNPVSGEIIVTGSAPLNEYLQILKSLVYSNSSGSLTPGNRIIKFIASDGIDASEIVSTTVMVQSDNSAPTLNSTAQMKLNDIDEDDLESAGEKITEILSSAGENPIQDADENALQGFAIVGADNTHGDWQYSVDGGISWISFGDVSDASAVLLTTAGRIRFVPLPNFNGPDGALTVRAWDQTTGANGSTGFNVTNNGGSTAFSSETAEISITVTSINDRPVITLPEGLTAVFVEDSDPVVVAGPSLSITDVDNENLVSAQVKIVNYAGNQPDFLEVTMNGSAINKDYDANNGALNLTGAGSLADYQAILRTVTFENLSQDPEGGDRIIAFSVSDSIETSAIVTGTVKVEPINDPPLVDLNGADTPGTNMNVVYEVDSGAQAIVAGLDLQDVDNTAIAGAIVTLEPRPDGDLEKLLVTTTGTNISQGYSSSSGKLILSGQDSIANYEQVLRSVKYRNQSTNPNRAERKITFAVTDKDNATGTAVISLHIIPQYIFFPVIANSSMPLSDEPNNNCNQAYPIPLNQTRSFEAEDVNDWYSFDLDKTYDVTIKLTNFAPEEGQILVAKGACGNLSLLGQNGDFATEKTIKINNIGAGRYYIWIIIDGPTNTGSPYNLKVETK